MKEQALSAEIYCDAAAPDLSIEPALHGINIVKTIAPWIKVLDDCVTILDIEAEPNSIHVDEVVWPHAQSDIAIVLTKRKLLGVNAPEQRRSQTAEVDLLGVTLTWYEPRFRQIVVADTSSIRRPEHIIAHEIGHVLGVEGSSEHPDDLHCRDRRCLMYPLQYRTGKSDRSFCECCSQQIHDNSLALRRAKTRRSRATHSEAKF